MGRGRELGHEALMIGGGAAIRGVVGQIKWSYYTAAAINGYIVRRSTDGAWSLSATVVLADAFKLTQKPLLFVAPHERGVWRWPIVDILDGHPTRFRATLGPPIE
jgi:hypothetical protein